MSNFGLFSNINTQTMLRLATGAPFFVARRNPHMFAHGRPLPPTPDGQEQRSPLEKQLFQKLIHLEKTETKLMPMAQIILLKNVEGIGKAGEVVSVRSHMVREFFIPSGSAVYASPYNVKKYSPLRDKTAESSMTPYQKLGISERLYDLAVFMNSKAVPTLLALENGWTLEKWHLKLALRLHDVYANESQIIINKIPIKGPNMKLQNELFRFYIIANKRIIIPCYGRYQHVTTKTYKQMLTPSVADPTSLTEAESKSANLIEEDLYVHPPSSEDLSMNDAQIWDFMQQRMEAKKKELETNPVLISRRAQAALEAEAKKKREKEVHLLKCRSFGLPYDEETSEREITLKKQKARRNRYWDDDAHNWPEPLGSF